MRSLHIVFSAPIALALCLLLTPSANAQVCQEPSVQAQINSGDIQWLSIINTSEYPISLFNKFIQTPEGDQQELTGILFPDEERIIILEDNILNANEFYIEGLDIDISLETANTPETEPEPVQQAAQIYLNEIFANPEGDETSQEFIELYNPNDFIVNLNNWSVSDNSKSVLLENLEILANSYLVLPRSLTSIALNNSNESIYLEDFSGLLIDEFSYETTLEGLSWNRDSTWYEVEPSEGLVNNLEPVVVEDNAPEETVQEETTPNEEAPPVGPQDPVADDNAVGARLIAPLLQEVRLSELLPNPEGSDEAEWIELFNPTEEAILLYGLSITDESKSYNFTDQEILPGEYFLLERSVSAIALNNSGDTISLIVEENIIDEFSYDSSQEDTSWGKNAEDIWEEQSPTPNAANTSLPEEPDPPVQVQTATKSSKKSKKSTPKIYTSWELAKHNNIVKLSGVIISPENIIRKNTLFIQTTTSIIEIYASKASYPKHNTGDKINIQGKKSISSKGERLLLQDSEDFIVLDETELLPVLIKTKDQLTKTPLATYIQIQGRLIEQNKKDLLLELDGDEWAVSLKLFPNLKLLPLNKDLIITGSVDINNAEKIIVPFLEEHIELVSIVETASEQPETIDIAISEDKRTSFSPPLLIGSAFAGIGGYLFRERLLGLFGKS